MQFYWETHWFSGSGTGLASQGVTYFELPTLVENGYATLLYEFGLLGILLWLWLVLALIYATHKATKRLRDTPFFLLGKSVLIFQFSFLLVLFVVGVSSYQDYIVGANIWFFSGVLFGISDNIEKPCQPQISHPTRSLRHTLHHQYAQTK
jgi:O-antigen ligase